MAKNETLLAYLVSKFSRSAEDTATDILVYILNKSKSAASIFNDLVGSIAPVPVQDCLEFATQEIEGRSRFDLVGYDHAGLRRVIGESKFGAALGKGQGKDYFAQLTQRGNAVLLFLVPDHRIDYLWEEVKKDVVGQEAEHEVLVLFDTNGRTRCAQKRYEDRYLIMLSWMNLLDALAETSNDEEGVKYDIEQLRGIVEKMERDSFKPMKKEELAPSFPKRLRQLQTLVDSAFETYVVKHRDSLTTRGYNATSTYDGYRRYFRLLPSNAEAWFGISYERWAEVADVQTPLWFGFQESNRYLGPESKAYIRRQMEERWPNQKDGSVPVLLKTDIDHEMVVAYLVTQLEHIAVFVGCISPPEELN